MDGSRNLEVESTYSERSSRFWWGNIFYVVLFIMWVCGKTVAQDWRVVHQNQNTASGDSSTRGDVKWQKQPGSMLKCNIDFSRRKQVWLRSMLERWTRLIWVRIAWHAGSLTTIEAKAFGLWLVLQWLQLWNQHHIHNETDCMNNTAVKLTV
jgi:hypothetical protein